jgi:Tfp pilus assembly protein PilF
LPQELHAVAKCVASAQLGLLKDPSFAPAYAGLAADYAFRSGTFNPDRDDELVKMRAAAEKAIQLDPLLPEAHGALGTVYARDGNWSLSEESFRRALELDSNNSRARDDFAMFLLLPLGRIEEAVRHARAAGKADPLSPQIQNVLAYILIAAGRFDEADGHCQKASDATECLGRVRLGQGRIDEAVQILSAFPNPRFYGHALGRAGRRDEAEALAATVATNPYQQALIYAGLGDKGRTFEALDRMTVQGPVRIGRTLMLPEFALIRADPRAKSLRQRVGLP